MSVENNYLCFLLEYLGVICESHLIVNIEENFINVLKIYSSFIFNHFDLFSFNYEFGSKYPICFVFILGASSGYEKVQEKRCLYNAIFSRNF